MEIDWKLGEFLHDSTLTFQDPLSTTWPSPYLEDNLKSKLSTLRTSQPRALAFREHAKILKVAFLTYMSTRGGGGLAFF